SFPLQPDRRPLSDENPSDFRLVPALLKVNAATPAVLLRRNSPRLPLRWKRFLRRVRDSPTLLAESQVLDRSRILTQSLSLTHRASSADCLQYAGFVPGCSGR